MKTEEETILQQQHSIKLYKNSKGYNWEIRIYGVDIDVVAGEIERINDLLQSKYGDINGI